MKLPRPLRRQKAQAPAPKKPRPPAPFVVGVSRSGTTLLRFMLDAHPELAIPPETHFIPDLVAECRREGATVDSAADLIISHRRFGDFGLDPDELRQRFRRSSKARPRKLVRAFYKLYAEQQGKPRWGDKTPNYIQSILQIDRLLPEARFIHLIRDGRDAALSRQSRAVEEPAPIAVLAKRWKRRILVARRHGRRVRHYMEARYEDLVTDPEPTLRRVCDFLDLDYDPAMLRYHEGAADRLADEMAHDLPATKSKVARPAEHRMEGHSLVAEPLRPDRLDRWRREMSAEDRDTFESFAGDLLDELGYEIGGVGRERAEQRRAKRRSRPPPAPFVVGVTRSGTTLLRLMLDAHPELAVPPETHFLTELIAAAGKRDAGPEALAEVIVGDRHWGDFALDRDEFRRRIAGLDGSGADEVARAFYSLYADREGKPRWGDKTPQYLKAMADIADLLPEAHFVHLIRDGRDAALSRADRVLKDPPPQVRVARRWKRRVLRARRDGRQLHHYLEARYEDLVTDPEPTLRRVCEFVELDYDPAMLSYHERAEERLSEMARDLPERPGQVLRPADHRLEAHVLTREPPRTDRVARWRTEMSPADQAVWSKTAGDLLAELGYDVPRGSG